MKELNSVEAEQVAGGAGLVISAANDVVSAVDPLLHQVLAVAVPGILSGAESALDNIAAALF